MPNFANAVVSPWNALAKALLTLCKSLPVAPLISKAVCNNFCAVVASPVACDNAINALVKSPPALPVAKASLSINCPINGAANARFIESKLLANNAASFSVAAIL